MITSVKDLWLQNVERKKLSHQIYKTMYIDVMSKIQEKHANHIYNLLYNAPTFVFGDVQYNKKTCIVYLVKKLSERGFVVFPYNYNTLYIDWSYILSVTPKNCPLPTSSSSKHDEPAKPTKRVTFDTRSTTSSDYQPRSRASSIRSLRL